MRANELLTCVQWLTYRRRHASVATPKATRTPARAANGGRRHLHVLIVGSGFSGLGPRSGWLEEGRDDFLVIERGSEVGGTWRDNTYPGAACDVPSHLYSYSFELNPQLVAVVLAAGRDPGLPARRSPRSTTCATSTCSTPRSPSPGGTTPRSSGWSTPRAATSRADVLVGAVGALCEPALPDIKGIETFAGEIFHSARWNHDADLTGKRVALIGTGASAIQIGPAIATTSRTSTSTSARRRGSAAPRPHLPEARAAGATSTFPVLQRAAREAIYWGREAYVLGFAFQPRILQRRAADRRAQHRQGHPGPAAARGGHPGLADRLQAHPDLQRLVPDARPRQRRSGHRRHHGDPRERDRRRRRHRARGRRHRRGHRLPRHRLARRTSASSARTGASLGRGVATSMGSRPTRARPSPASRTCCSSSARTAGSGTARWCT